MQKNENQNRWAPIVVGLLGPIQGSICTPGHWEVNPTPAFSQHRNRGRRSKNSCSNMFTCPRNVFREVQTDISFWDMRNECNGLHLNRPLNCGFLVFLFITRFWVLPKRTPLRVLSKCLYCITCGISAKQFPTVGSSKSKPLLLHVCWTCSMQTMAHTVAAVFCAADWHNKATHCCEDMLGCLAVTPLLGQNRSIVCHLIMHKPSRLKEYVSDAG